MTTRVVTLRGLEGALGRDLAKLKRRVRKGMENAARASAPKVKARTPKAFGELRDSIRVVLAEVVQIRVEAPHAAAVEIGSRPHYVPLDELVKWVKLRGMQGLSRAVRKRNPTPTELEKFSAKHGPTTRQMARVVAGSLKQLEKNGSLDIDAPVAIAKAIQAKIAKVGTKPHHFVLNSIDPVIIPDLDTHINRALKT